jgi:hypothetical protein
MKNKPSVGSIVQKRGKYYIKVEGLYKDMHYGTWFVVGTAIATKDGRRYRKPFKVTVPVSRVFSAVLPPDRGILCL